MSTPMVTRPLTDFSWCRPDDTRVRSQFRGTYEQSLSMLRTEVERLNARDAVLQVACSETQISRGTGMVLVNAAIEHPACRLLIDTTDRGLLAFSCDRYVTGYGAEMSRDWMHNLRAIALTLQALRAVDRYGATDTGQQYRGYLAIEGRSLGIDDIGMSETDAKAHLLRLAFGRPGGLESTWTAGHWDEFEPELILRRATLKAHPDQNAGDDARWNLLHNATAVLRARGVIA